MPPLLSLARLGWHPANAGLRGVAGWHPDCAPHLHLSPWPLAPLPLSARTRLRSCPQPHCRCNRELLPSSAARLKGDRPPELKRGVAGWRPDCAPRLCLSPWPLAPLPLCPGPLVPKTWPLSPCCLPLLRPQRGAGLFASNELLCNFWLASAGNYHAVAGVSGAEGSRPDCANLAATMPLALCSPAPEPLALGS